MIVDDLDVEGMTVTPPETDPPLLVDPDAVLTLTIAFQGLELIRARNRKVFQVSRRVQLLQRCYPSGFPPEPSINQLLSFLTHL